MRKIHLDLRQFALPCPRSGSIETNSGYGPPPLSGQEIHQLLQARREQEIPGYASEVRLSHSFHREPYVFHVSGRADGVLPGTPVTIEEIKTSFDLEDLFQKLSRNEDHPYLWQLRTYGYIYLQQTGQTPKLKFHLVSSRNLKSLELDVEFSREFYEAWLERRLAELVKETRLREKLFKKRQKTAAALEFPFPEPRPGQRELVSCLEEAFAEKKRLLVQAPTGLGKTAGVLFPSLKDALARGQKVIYVTPKNSQHQVAEEALEKLQDQGAKIRALTLNAKHKMCLKEEVLCHPRSCEFARDYYRKLAEQDLINKLSKVKNLSPRKLKSLGTEYEVCPFELSVEAVERADVVIADYNYVFAPRSLLGKLSEPLMKPSEKANLVVDEAHNLPARAQDYFSPSLGVAQLRTLEESMKLLEPRFSAPGLALLAEARALIQSYGQEGPRRIEILPEPFLDLDAKIRELTLKYLESAGDLAPQDPMLKWSHLWSEFLQSLELKGPAFFQSVQKDAQHEDILKITCCDASEHLAKTYKEFHNVVAFSATLKPFEYYQSLMGLTDETTKCVEFLSPFPADNRKLLVIPQISTLRRNREFSAPRIADVISRVVRLKPGNYIALFPSFEFLLKTRAHLQLPEFQLLVQTRDMKAAAVQAILTDLREQAKPHLLLAVQGGVFSEGLDYRGDMLIGAFIVGPALPTFDFEREQMRIYYENTYGKDKGFDYTYVYPAMAKAIQSAGRVIRSEKDQGVIILMDPRFLQSAYARSMPQGWFQISPQELVSQSILSDIARFWRECRDKESTV